MAVIIQIRRDTATNWVNFNPLLANGEFGLETDTNNLKIGNGVDNWNNLPYIINTVTSGGFLYEQTTPSNLWIINHNLDKYTHVTVYDSNDNAVFAQVEKISPNGIRILFNEPMTGTAIIS